MTDSPTLQEHWTARHRKPVLFIIIVLALFGVYLAFGVPVAVFPSTNFPRIVIGIDNGVTPIDQMQITVTRPIEQSITSVPGLDHVLSLTSRGSSEVDLFFNWNVDMVQTLQLVNAAVAKIQNTLPVSAVININRLTFAAFPILGYSITASNIPPSVLWQLATYNIKPQLTGLPGIASVQVQGSGEPEFAVQPDPGKLVQSRVAIPNLLDSIARSNIIESPGLLQHDHQLFLGLVSGQVHNPAEIGGVVVKLTPSGSPVRISDVATVSPSTKPEYTVVTANGRPAVLVNIFRQPDSNTVSVAKEVQQQLDDLRKTLPAGVSIQPFYDQSQLVSQAIGSVRDAICIGIFLAAVILVLFLHDWRTSIVAGLVIPVTIAITLIVLRALGQSFNLMTLGGLAAAVGLIIDDAIVVVENIVLHLDSGDTRAQAIGKALRELRVPLVGSTITPIVVLVPLVAIHGVTGVFFQALALTVAVALLTSLLLALTWTPALSSLLLRPQRHSASAKATLITKTTNLYARATHLFLQRRWLLPLFCIALIAISFGCYQFLGSDLLPTMDEGGFVLDYLMPAGSSLADTNRVLNGVEKILHSIPEVQSTSRRTGLQLGLAAVTEANTGDISVMLKQNRSRGVEEVIADVRDKVNTQYPQLDTDFHQVLEDMIGDLTSSPDPIEVKLFSENVDLLREWSPKIGDAIKTLSPVKDVKDGIENTVSGPALTFQVNQSVASRAGFSPQEVALDAGAVFQGVPAATPIIVGNHPQTVRVTFPPFNRASLDAIQNTLLVSTSGSIATLGTLATVRDDPGQIEIRRENLQRDVAVTARLEGTSLGQGIALVKKKVAGLHLPTSLRVAYGGLYEQQQQSFHDLLFVLALSVVLLFTVLLIEFGTFAAPTAILVSALLSTSGVVLALLITNTTFNISSFMGLIMVVGIVAKNGILLLDAEQKFRISGSPAREAITQAGARRLRPILMTTLATTAGMIPLAFALGAGSQMLRPLAIAVIGGVLSSTVLSLLITPTVHYYLHRESPRA